MKTVSGCGSSCRSLFQPGAGSLRVLECLAKPLDDAGGTFVIGDDVLQDVVQLGPMSSVFERKRCAACALLRIEVNG